MNSKYVHVLDYQCNILAAGKKEKRILNAVSSGLRVCWGELITPKARAVQVEKKDCR